VDLLDLEALRVSAQSSIRTLVNTEAVQTAVETVRQLSGGKVDVLLCNAGTTVLRLRIAAWTHHRYCAGAHQLDDTPLALGREEELAEKLQAAFRVNTGQSPR
jgi:NAD(P)-dependent dehydrogenase (short-subunit alcohol dehydrogenase family)